MARAYYNEIDPAAAAWLRELIARGHIAAGDVDERSILDVQADDLVGYAQCHFFAGIGGWSYALRLAGWPDDRPVWTGSCPCQPFSNAGKRKGTADERHLWPEFARLIGHRQPEFVFGEQVASAAGRDWLSAVRIDLEAMGYAVGAADLCAASVGAPHIRQRLYWGACRLGDTLCKGLEGHTGHGDHWSEPRRVAEDSSRSIAKTSANRTNHWDSAEYYSCSDGKKRPFKPEIQPMAYRNAGRVGILRGAGNAIVPQVAQAFIEAFCEAVDELR